MSPARHGCCSSIPGTDPTHTGPPPLPLMAGEFLLFAGEGDVYSAEEAEGWLGETG